MKKTPPTPGRPFAEAEAADSFHKAGRLMKQKHYALAIQLYEDIVHNYADTPFAKQAGKRLAKIHKDADVMTRVRDAAAEKKCTAWLEMARGLVKAGRRDAARKYYKRIIKGYGDTTYARTARQEIADL
ncbi:MAG: tol-pal system YbgF family protein [Phycisphaerae bacterium]